MRRMSRWIALGATLGVLSVSACGTNQPAVCDSLDAVRQSVSQLQHVNVAENGLSQLKTDLSQLKRDLQQLSTNAQAQFGSGVTGVRTAADQLSASVATAQATPNASTLAGVRASLTAVQDSVRQLGDSMRGTC